MITAILVIVKIRKLRCPITGIDYKVSKRCNTMEPLKKMPDFSQRQPFDIINVKCKKKKKPPTRFF